MKQSDIFLKSEGERWFERNESRIDKDDDPVLKLIESSEITPECVLEVGCANGWRLLKMREMYECRIHGVEPGATDTSPPFVSKGHAADLSLYNNDFFDLVIYGFCLYLADREDLFRIVAEGDRVLKDGGHLVIYDFAAEKVHARAYHHLNGIRSFKMNYATLWTANPAYQSIAGTIRYIAPDDAIGVTILKKDIEAAWPIKSS